MLHLLALALLIGIVDSVNPSTVAPALYLAAGTTAVRSLLGFLAGILSINLAGGIGLTFGLGRLFHALTPGLHADAKHALEVALGGALVLLAIGLWLGRRRVGRRVLGSHDRISRASFLIGAGIAAVELPTAVPYFAVIAAVVGSGRGLVTEIEVLVVFNLAFVAPIFAILGVRSLAGDRGVRALEQVRLQLERQLAVAIPAVVLVIAIILLTVGGAGLAR